MVYALIQGLAFFSLSINGIPMTSRQRSVSGYPALLSCLLSMFDVRACDTGWNILQITLKARRRL